MAAELIIDPRFCGPAGYGNGGYCCGIFANELEGPAEVTLRAPVQLDKSYVAVRDGEGLTIQADDGSLVAQVAPVGPLDDLEPPVRPSAERGSRRRRGLTVQDRRPSVPRLLRLWSRTPPRPADPGRSRFRVTRLLRPPPSPLTIPCRRSTGSCGPNWSGPPSTARASCRACGPMIRSCMGRLTAELLAPVPIGEEVVAVAWETGSRGAEASFGERADRFPRRAAGAGTRPLVPRPRQASAARRCGRRRCEIGSSRHAKAAEPGRPPHHDHGSRSADLDRLLGGPARHAVRVRAAEPRQRGREPSLLRSRRRPADHDLHQRGARGQPGADPDWTPDASTTWRSPSRRRPSTRRSSGSTSAGSSTARSRTGGSWTRSTSRTRSAC